MIAATALGLGAVHYVEHALNSIPAHPRRRLRSLRAGAPHPLFDRYPGLADRIPWLPIGSFPTPVEEFPAPCEGTRLFVKRDDQSALLYGGNKVRKLEHFLGDAILRRSTSLITLGGIGSNHALATATFARELGLPVDLFLYDQPLNTTVQRNLLAFADRGARVHHSRTLVRAFVDARAELSRRRLAGEQPYFVMVGGTNRLGCIGHVTAGLELADQVAAGELPEPSSIFVPLGTAGTAAGLIVGIKLGGLRTRVYAVRVADPFPANAFMLRRYAQDVADFLSYADTSVPRMHIGSGDFSVVTHHFGAGYGHPTEAGQAARSWAAPSLALETTYSSKALAACLEHCAGSGAGETVLFWNTYSSAHLEPSSQPHSLPPSLQTLLGEQSAVES